MAELLCPAHLSKCRQSVWRFNCRLVNLSPNQSKDLSTLCCLSPVDVVDGVAVLGRLSFSFSLPLCSGPETLPTVLCMCEKCSQIEAKRSRKAQGASSDVRHRPRCLWPLAVKIYLIAGYKQLLIWHKLIPSLTPPTGCQGVRQA